MLNTLREYQLRLFGSLMQRALAYGLELFEKIFFQNLASKISYKIISLRHLLISIISNIQIIKTKERVSM